MISRSELLHYKIQAAMREHSWIDDELKYLGEREGHHWYLIKGEHMVKAEEIEGFDRIDDEGQD